MKFKGLDGKIHIVDIKQSKFPLRTRRESKSNFQYKVGLQLRKLYPRYVVAEEFSIPGTRFKIDFFLPALLLAIEVDGKQHGEYIPFFHNSRLNFQRSLERDKEKEMWCKINNINLIRIKEGDDVREKIKG